MLVYKYDGTIDGLFSTVFESFASKENPDNITTENIQLMLDCKVKTIKTDYEHSKRVINCIYKLAGINALNDIRYAFRSGDEQKENKIFNYVCKIVNEKRNIANKFSDQVVMDFYDTIKKVGNEVHRFKGFIRFNECASGIYYAHFSPDNDIVDLLLPHFMVRFKNLPFVLHDVKRNIVAMYCNGESKVIQAAQTLYVQLSNDELEFQNLWQTYYDNISIPERKNIKLMNSFLPIKYHAHLTEKTANAVHL